MPIGCSDPAKIKVTGLYLIKGLYQFWVFDSLSPLGEIVATLDAAQAKNLDIVKAWINHTVLTVLSMRYFKILRAGLGVQ